MKTIYYKTKEELLQLVQQYDTTSVIFKCISDFIPRHGINENLRTDFIKQ